METSRTIHSFKVSVQNGQTLLTAQEYPWSVLQVVPTTAEDFDKTVEKLKERGMVGTPQHRPHILHNTSWQR